VFPQKVVDYETFSRQYQVCKRCTNLKHRDVSSDRTHSYNEMSPVVVRTRPMQFESERVNCCEHFQWTWCPGIDGNSKCQVLCCTDCHLLRCAACCVHAGAVGTK